MPQVDPSSANLANLPVATLPQLSVQNLAACEVAKGYRLQGAAVDADTMYLVVAGTMHMQLADDHLRVDTGSVLLVPAGLQPHIAPQCGAAAEILATRNILMRDHGLLVFDATGGKSPALRVLVGRIGGGASIMLEAKGPVHASIKDDPLSRHAIEALDAELDSPGPGATDLVAALMKLCFMKFVRQMPHGETAAISTETSTGRGIARAVAAVLSQPALDHSIAALAKRAGMSRASFLRHFSRHTGASPRDFVMKARLTEASNILASTQMTIKEVAAAAGFSSRSHFSRAFQTAFGSSPKEYRARHPQDRDTILIDDDKTMVNATSREGSREAQNGSIGEPHANHKTTRDAQKSTENVAF